jgi:hypothetical protein
MRKYVFLTGPCLLDVGGWGVIGLYNLLENEQVIPGAILSTRKKDQVITSSQLIKPSPAARRTSDRKISSFAECINF